jgi:hypothetical protein
MKWLIIAADMYIGPEIPSGKVSIVHDSKKRKHCDGKYYARPCAY